MKNQETNWRKKTNWRKTGISANSRVRLKINPAKLAAMYPDPDEWRPTPDKDGFTEWTFWVLVAKLGPVSKWGAVVIESEIEVAEDVLNTEKQCTAAT